MTDIYTTTSTSSQTQENKDIEQTMNFLQSFREAGCYIAEFGSKKNALVEAGFKLDPFREPQSWADFEQVSQRILTKKEKANWGILPLKESLLVMIDIDNKCPTVLVNTPCMNRRKILKNDGGEISSRHIFFQVIDADHSWCRDFAKKWHNHANGVEIYAEKHWCTVQGSYTNPGDPEHLTGWHPLHLSDKGKLIQDIPKEDLEKLIESAVKEMPSELHECNIREIDGGRQNILYKTPAGKGKRHLAFLSFAGSIINKYHKSHKEPPKSSKIVLDLMIKTNTYMNDNGEIIGRIENIEEYAEGGVGFNEGQDMIRHCLNGRREQAQTTAMRSMLDDEFHAIHRHDTGELMTWDRTHYTGVHDGINASEKVLQFLAIETGKWDNAPNAAQVRSMYDMYKIQSEKETAWSMNRGDGIGFENGWLDFKTNRLVENKPSNLNLQCIRLNYMDMSENYPVDKEYSIDTLDEIFSNILWWKTLKECHTIDDKLDFENLYRALEAMACSIGDCTDVQKWFAWHGAGSNGKSLFLEVLLKMFSPYTSTVGLYEITTDPYAAAELHTSYLNVDTDTDFTKPIQNWGKMNKIVCGESVRGRRIYQAPFQFKPKGVWIIGMNNLPQTYNQTDAVWRRICIVEWNRQFKGDEADKTLKNRLMADRNTWPMIIGMLVNIRRKLKERGWNIRFDKGIDETREYWYEHTYARGIDSYLEDCFIEGDEEDFVTSADLDFVHRTYCDKRGIKPESKKRLAQEYTKMGWYRTRKESSRGWKGVQFAPEWHPDKIRKELGIITSSNEEFKKEEKGGDSGEQKKQSDKGSLSTIPTIIGEQKPIKSVDADTNTNQQQYQQQSTTLSKEEQSKEKNTPNPVVQQTTTSQCSCTLCRCTSKNMCVIYKCECCTELLNTGVHTCRGQGNSKNNPDEVVVKKDVK